MFSFVCGAKKQREMQCELISIMSDEWFDKMIVIYREKLQYNKLLSLVIARRLDSIRFIDILIRLTQTGNPFKTLEDYSPYSIKKTLASYICLVLMNCLHNLIV